MFDGGIAALAEAVEGLDVPAHGEALVSVRRLLDLAEAKLASAEAAYAAAEGPRADGFGSLASFVRHRGGLGLQASRRVDGRARRLRACPELEEAWCEGRLTGPQVELVTEIVPSRHVPRFAETIADTIEILSPLSAHQSGKALRRWVEMADAETERETAEEGDGPTEPAPLGELSAVRSLDDRLYLKGHLDDIDDAAIVERALAAATRPDRDDERRGPAQRRADALVELCRHYLLQPPDPARVGDTGRLMVLADVVALHRAVLRGAGVRTAEDLEAFLGGHPELGELEIGLFLAAFDHDGGTPHTIDGRPVTDHLVHWVASGGTLERLLTSEGRLLELGRSVRTFTPAQRRAVLARDEGCRSPGCHAPPERCDVHHVVPWEAGGPTDVDNAVAKCRACHHDHHRRGLVDRLDPDGAYVLTTPTGRELASPSPLTDDVRLPLERRSRAAPDPPRPPKRDRRRPRCDCACEHHPTAHEQNERRRWARIVRRRLVDDGLILGA